MSASVPAPSRGGRSRTCGRGLLPLALALLASGCAGHSQQRRLEQEAARFIYVAPAPKVMAQARSLLEARGYTVRDEPGDRPVLSTPWKQLVDAEGIASQVRRYLVAGKDLGQGRMLVRIYSITYTTVGTVDAHPSLGNHSYQRGEGGGGAGGGGRMPFQVAGQGAAAAKGWAQRDLEMEWQLLERLEPELAQALKDERSTTAVAAAPAASEPTAAAPAAAPHGSR